MPFQFGVPYVPAGVGLGQHGSRRAHDEVNWDS